MINFPIVPAAAAILAVVATVDASALAGEAQDKIFRVGLLGGVEVGQTLIFARERAGADAASPPIDDGEIKVAVIEEAGQRIAQMELRAPGQAPSGTRLPADGGHPVLLVFLETTARTMAEATGGSPFYIRNRMRESLGADVPLDPVEVTLAGKTISAQAATFRPFENDPNREKMGQFADLALILTLSDAVPGGFVRFEAAGAGPDGEAGFSEAIDFDRLDAE